jgi:hypothetical protein
MILETGIRASLAGRRILPTQTIRLGPFASREGHNLRHGPARLAGAPNGPTHPVRAGSFLIISNLNANENRRKLK